MATSKDDIRQWLKRGRDEGRTHLVVVCDTFDYEDYPTYVSPGEDPHEFVRKKREESMQRVMEVYNLSLDDEQQLAEHRAFNF